MSGWEQIYQLNSVEYRRVAKTFTEYVKNYPDLVTAYNADTSQSIEAWGKSHYCNHGRNEGRVYIGTADCSSTTTASRDSY